MQAVPARRPLTAHGKKVETDVTTTTAFIEGTCPTLVREGHSHA
jgi:hypothetical protein